MSDNIVKTPVIEHIRNNATGEVRKYETTGCIFLPDTEPHWWYWEEGNMACDCNRRLHFEYAVGKNYDEIEGVECGSDGFSMNVEWNGAIYYREFLTL